MKYLIFCFLSLPTFLGAQCYGSFEFFGATGFSNTPNSFTEGRIEYDPASVYRFGFGASFRLGQRTYLRTGVQFSTYGSRYLNDDLQWGTQHNGEGGFNTNATGGSGRFDISERHFYGEGMLALRYQFKTWSNWQPFVEGGLALGKYGTTFTKTTVSGGSENTNVMFDSGANNNFRSLSVIGRLGAGTNFNFNERVGVYGMAVLQRHLQNLNTVGPARVHPWQATLEVGVRVFVDPR